MILEKLRSCGTPLPAQNRPPEGFAWVVQNFNFLGTFSLTKALAQTREIELCSISCRATKKENAAESLSATWRLNDKGFSSSAELDQRLCLWKPQPFEKGWRKLLFFPHKLGAARQRVGFRTKPIRELGAGSACSVFTLCVGALLWDTDGVDHLVVLLLHLGFGSDAGQLHRLQRLIDAV